MSIPTGRVIGLKEGGQEGMTSSRCFECDTRALIGPFTMLSKALLLTNIPTLLFAGRKHPPQ